jgi:resolvase-like protein
LLKPRIFKQRTADHHMAAYLFGTLPEIDKFRSTAVYVRQSQTGADDAHGESRKTQLALQDYAARIRNDGREGGVRLYDEGAGKSGQKRIDQRPELNRLYSDIEAGLVSTIIVAREGRLFRDKHGEQVGLFTSLLERKGVVILVPPIGQNGSLKLYDLQKYEHLKASNNVTLVGWWPTGEDDEVIVNNHTAVIPRELFEEGYMKRHGYTLDGEPVPDMLLRGRMQVRKTWETPPEALLHGKLLCAGEEGQTRIHVDFKGLDQPFYVATYKKDGHLYRDIAFSLECAPLDAIVVDRLEMLAKQDVNMARVIEKSLEQTRVQQATGLVSIKDQLVNIDKEVASQTQKLVNIEATIPDADIRAGVALAITTRLNELGVKRAVLVEKKRKLNVIDSREEVREFYDLFNGNFKEAWAKRTLEQRQKLISLITTSITLRKLSPHWVQLSISWMAPLMPWGDICFVWRQSPSRGAVFSEEDLDIIRKHYPTCASPIELMRLLPDRTWYGIKQQANLAGITRTFKMSKANIPTNACWIDIDAFEEEITAVEMIREATQTCRVENQPSPLPASPEHAPLGTVNLDMAEELNSQENPYGDRPASSDQYSENSGGRS